MAPSFLSFVTVIMKNSVRCTEHYLADRAMQTNFMLALRSYSTVYFSRSDFYMMYGRYLKKTGKK